MSAKHTPGPWAIRYDYVVQAQSFDGGRLVPVAQPYGVNCDGTDLFANARLIAAAPDLLEALRMWMDIHEKPAGFAGKYGKALDAAIHAQQVKVDAAAAAARAAIAKATGEKMP